MKDHLIFAIGVGVLLTVIKIAIFGSTAKALCLLKLVNMECGYEHLCLIQSENPQWLFRGFTSKKKENLRPTTIGGPAPTSKP